MTEWADRLVTIALRWKEGEASTTSLFIECSPPAGLSLDAVRVELIERLNRNSELVQAWQTYSYDTRCSPSPYVDGHEVGFFDGDRRDVARYATQSEACADFVVREMQWVLHRRRTNHG